METAMPKIDWDAIEAHLKATKEEERRRRNDREEIRRKLAMGFDEDQVVDKPHRKPSLHSRLQSGMNLQICFMNETASDCESQCSDTESTQDRDTDTSSGNSKASTPQALRTCASRSEPDVREKEVDFFARQAQLQAEARMALAQAKEMARMQMEIEKQSKKKSPIADIVRASFNKIGVPFPDSKRRISRQILTDMNVAQLQVIVNDLHTQIESLNEDLVTFLMERDDLHMEQDSMLVDIEDLTKHIGAKEMSLRGSVDSAKTTPASTPPTRSKSSSLRLKNMVKK
ncbi:schwannomin-interacting protein 1-like [Homarus americanus]|nr:schwannomin-interacting protein 1-like [Homarus americanus]